MPQIELISKNKVQPSGPYDSKILFVGEAPGFEEDTSGIPFDENGDAGKLFNALIGTLGFNRSNCRVTNICNYRPNNNKFDLVAGSRQLSEGIKEVQEYIKDQKPDWVVLLGAKPLEYLLGKKGRKNGVENWRGSVIIKDDQKYFISLHPAAVLYVGTLYPLLSFDFARLDRYIRDGYVFPHHDFVIDPDGMDLHEYLNEIESSLSPIAVDLEGVKETFHILSAQFGLSKSRAICLFNHASSGLDPVFEQSIRRILENPKIEKIFQNGYGYDVEMLKENGIDVKGYIFDTMIAAHVLEPEMPYGLGFLTSIYTDEPYYKNMVSSDDEDDGKGVSREFDKMVLGDYGCRDVIVDITIAEKQKRELQDRGLWDTYEYKHSLIPLGQTLSRTGLLIDQERKSLINEIVIQKYKYYQELLNGLAGFKVNVKSGIHMKKLLIDTYNLPVRKHPKTKAPTYNEDAIVSYLSFIQDKINGYKTAEKIEEWEWRLGACKCILHIRGLRQLKSNYIDIKISWDNRLRSIYNFCAATETGRGSSHGYIDGTGLNAQTFPREKFEITEEEYNKLMERVREKNENSIT